MKQLTSKQRVMRIFENKETDRPALKLWGLDPRVPPLHDKYKPVIDAALKYTDLFVNASSPFHLLAGRNCENHVFSEEVKTPSPHWIDKITTVQTNKGNLRAVHRVSTIGEPGYCTEYLVKEPRDIEKLLSLPYHPIPLNMDGYNRAEREIGDAGIVMFYLPHAAYGFQDLCGSENIVYFKNDEPELVNEIVDTFSQRIRHQAEAVINAGYKPVFSWVGPELFIPPLMGPQDFENFVFRFDKPLCDLIHNGGGYVWVHCHGKVAGFIQRFIDMGADVLNPLEPPSKNGDAIR
jgi:hypothetical protein